MLESLAAEGLAALRSVAVAAGPKVAEAGCQASGAAGSSEPVLTTSYTDVGEVASSSSVRVKKEEIEEEFPGAIRAPGPLKQRARRDVTQ